MANFVKLTRYGAAESPVLVNFDNVTYVAAGAKASRIHFNTTEGNASESISVVEDLDELFDILEQLD